MNSLGNSVVKISFSDGPKPTSSNKYQLMTSPFNQDDFQPPQGVFVREPKLAFKLLASLSVLSALFAVYFLI